MADRYVKIDFDREECDVMAELAENAAEIARLRGWDSARQQKIRVITNRIRYKMNISASLLNHGEVRADERPIVHLPPWYDKRS
jgi:hypothetical protein